jgi:AcrR family transcriptional regulator
MTKHETRDAILQAAFSEIYQNGFQAAGLAEILSRANVTKGALYHYFPSKTALGHAVVDEVVHELIEEMWIKPMDANPGLEGLQATILATPDRIEALGLCRQQGCPLNNLAQEMSPIDPVFRQKISELFGNWRTKLAASLRHDQEAGRMRVDVDADHTALFVIGALGGCLNLSKTSADDADLRACMGVLLSYLETLKVNTQAKSQQAV